MAKSKIHFDVILTPEARALLKEEVISVMMREDKYFNCLSVEPNGYFTDLVVEFMLGGKKQQSELSIPSHYILYIINARKEKAVGFSG